jgi:hypothetical protein
MSEIAELFGYATTETQVDWRTVVGEQRCPFLGRVCYKVRKSDPSISIGTCTVLHGRPAAPTIVCPARFLERRHVFTDCLHLLTLHEPGNDLHVVPEVSLPRGSVDYFLVSARQGRVQDFVGIELQALDTTGTIWPERQRLLVRLGILSQSDTLPNTAAFGMNWKMTAKTTLLQLHHKVRTFEHLHKKLVLVLQDRLLAYLAREFDFAHLHQPARLGDAMHFHAYAWDNSASAQYCLAMQTCLSTDSDGIAACLGLKADANLELAQIYQLLESKLSPTTYFAPV